MKSSIFEGLRLGARSQPTSLAELLTSVAALDADGKAAISAALTAGDEPAVDPEAILDEVAPGDEPKGGEPEVDAEALQPDATDQTFADGVSAERARTKSVMTCEHFAGREALAAELLDSDLPAERISATLAKSPKVGASTNHLNVLAQGGQPELGGGGGEPAPTREASDAVWDKARAAVSPAK